MNHRQSILTRLRHPLSGDGGRVPAERVGACGRRAAGERPRLLGGERPAGQYGARRPAATDAAPLHRAAGTGGDDQGDPLRPDRGVGGRYRLRVRRFRPARDDPLPAVRAWRTAPTRRSGRRSRRRTGTGRRATFPSRSAPRRISAPWCRRRRRRAAGRRSGSRPFRAGSPTRGSPWRWRFGRSGCWCCGRRSRPPGRPVRP